MNKQSNSYTIIYSIGMVLIVGIVLSVVYQVLKPQQDENIANDKKKQILAAALIAPKEGENIAELYDKLIIDSYLIDSKGNITNNDKSSAFNVNVAQEVKKDTDNRSLPVFVCQTPDGKKYIVPVYGAGLWGPIWGYVCFNDDCSTIYGAYFAHQGETPGLGAEIETPAFQEQFIGKSIYNKEGEFESVAIVKTGQEPADKEYVHAISGGTITSQGVHKMLENSLAPYNQFFNNIKNADR